VLTVTITMNFTTGFALTMADDQPI